MYHPYMAHSTIDDMYGPLTCTSINDEDEDVDNATTSTTTMRCSGLRGDRDGIEVRSRGVEEG